MGPVTSEIVLLEEVLSKVTAECRIGRDLAGAEVVSYQHEPDVRAFEVTLLRNPVERAGSLLYIIHFNEAQGEVITWFYSTSGHPAFRTNAGKEVKGRDLHSSFSEFRVTYSPVNGSETNPFLISTLYRQIYGVYRDGVTAATTEELERQFSDVEFLPAPFDDKVFEPEWLYQDFNVHGTPPPRRTSSLNAPVAAQ